MRKKVPFVEQMEHSECGLACLTMILKYYNHQVDLYEMRNDFGIPKNGSSFFQLSKMANEKGMRSKAYACDSDSIKEIESPSILHWENKHFVVLEKIKKDKFFVVDPAFGRRIYTKEEFDKLFSRKVISLTPGDGFQKRKKTLDLKFFLDILTNHKKSIAFIISVSLLLQGVSIAIPLLTKWLTDEVLVLQQKSLLDIFGYGVLTIFFLSLLLSFVRGFLIAKLQTKMDSFMMSKFIHKLFHLPYSFFENRASGELLFRSNINVYIRQILSTNAVSFFIDLILLVTYSFIMFYFSIKLSLIVFAIAAVLLSILLLNTKIIKKLSDKNVTSQSEVQKYLSEHIYGISDVKMLGNESVVFDDWQTKFNEQLITAEKRSIWTSGIHSFSSSVQIILPIFLLWIGGHFVVQGEITLGTLIAFTTMAGSFISPIVSISNGYTSIIYLGSYFQKLMDVINSSSEQVGDKTAERLDGDIEVRNVSFSYDKFSENVLEDISLTIKKGEKVAIVGESGSGKSTLAKILLGLYRPPKGEIFLDNCPIGEYDLKEIRRNMGAVLQESRLFNQTVYENIAMSTGASYEEVAFATLQSNMLEDIKKLPLGLNTTISENGINFSGGQRQRLILSRALVKKPNILVLDEATSALDSISEGIIEEAVSDLSCTRVIIAHRLSTIKNADKIYVLDKGRIVEEGTHEELMMNKDVYFNLYRNQSNNKKYSEPQSIS